MSYSNKFVLTGVVLWALIGLFIIKPYFEGTWSPPLKDSVLAPPNVADYVPAELEGMTIRDIGSAIDNS